MNEYTQKITLRRRKQQDTEVDCTEQLVLEAKKKSKEQSITAATIDIPAITSR
jgi:hypothetical protein